MQQRFYDGASCRQNFMYMMAGLFLGSSSGSYRGYLHPGIGDCETPDGNMVKCNNLKLTQRAFANDLWKYILHDVPGFKDLVAADKDGVYYTSRKGEPYAHIILGFVKHAVDLSVAVGKPETWTASKFRKALRLSNVEKVNLQKHDGVVGGMVVKFYATIAGLRQMDDDSIGHRVCGFKRTTDGMVIPYGSVIPVPSNVQITAADKVFLNKFHATVKRFPAQGIVV